MGERSGRGRRGNAGRTHPDPIIVTLPDERFEEQVKREEWGSNHEGSASDHDCRRSAQGPASHRAVDSFRFSTLVTAGKEAQMRGCV